MYEITISSIIAIISLIITAYVIGLRTGNRDMDNLKGDIIAMRLEVGTLNAAVNRLLGIIEKGSS